MKTAILTFIRAYNHGAVLQCYALHKKLKDLGVDNEVLDYYPAYFRKVYNLETIRKWRWFPGSYFKRTLPYLKMRLRLSKRNKGFDHFIRKNIQLSSKQYHSLEDISKEEFLYDMFVVGSDQVWSHIWTEFDPVFFLDFPAARKSRKMSYAASFGFSTVPEELKDEYQRRLSNWDAYSVREESGQKILSQLLGVQSDCCCDPTLLLTREDWSAVAGKPVRRRPYILLYYVNGNRVLLEHAKKLAEKENLDIITLTSICTYEHLMENHKDIPSAKHMASGAPDDFLQLISQAKYVLTDSFHGTVFSILFHRKFKVLLNWKNHTNNRAAELLERLSLSERALDQGIEGIDEEISWSYVDDQLQEYRKQSVDYLQKQCGNEAV